MAYGLPPKVENLQLEDVELLTENQIKNEIGVEIINPPTTVLDHLKRNFLACGIDINQQFDGTSHMRNLPVQKLRIKVWLLRMTMTELALYSPEFRQHNVDAKFGTKINCPYDMKMEDFLPQFLNFIGLNNTGMLQIPSKGKNELIMAITSITNMVKSMCFGGIPFHLWPIPDQLI